MNEGETETDDKQEATIIYRLAQGHLTETGCFLGEETFASGFDGVVTQTHENCV